MYICILQGKLENGQIFDASKKEPIKFKLGEGRVIKGNKLTQLMLINQLVMQIYFLFSGWDKGISGMCVGYAKSIPYRLNQ